MVKRMPDQSNTTSINTLDPLPIVRALLLAQLYVHPHSSGYDLMHLVRTMTKGKVILKSGTVYPVLQHSEQDGLVTSTQEKERRKRRSYQLTAKGERELHQIKQQIQFRTQNILQPLLTILKGLNRLEPEI
jgi:DNA-binding PadR family transcriptional regulator